LSPQKNIPLLIDAFEMLLKDHTDYILRVYGEGPEKDNLKAYIKEKHLEDKAFIEDFASDIHERIKDAAMFVSTSDFEGLSNSMLEAMGIGLPVVCTDCPCGGAKMVIEDGVNGLLTPVGDGKAMYLAMKKILDDKNLANTLSANAKKVRNEYSRESIVEKWYELL
jgi:glycosyltransferase involved in cell wall biosynthesis